MAANKTSREDLKLLYETALEAGEIAMRYFMDKNEVWYKQGNSPVSQADMAIDALLRETFARERPAYGWLSEETEDDTRRLNKERVVITDPIDGTRGFIKGSKEWCISIAIVEAGRPYAAILHCPALERTFLASKGGGFELKGPAAPITETRARPLITGSKKVLEQLHPLEGKSIDLMPFIPSLAYRLAKVAIGELDGALARPGASEWDIAAADLILEEAGAQLTSSKGEVMRYNCKNVKTPGLVAAGCKTHSSILSLAQTNRIFH